MPISRPCEHCGKVKRCQAYKTPETHITALGLVHRLTYLCRPCARELGYR